MSMTPTICLMALCMKARICSLCQGGERFTETQLHCLGIWLHAYRYQVGTWLKSCNNYRMCGLHRSCVLRYFCVVWCSCPLSPIAYVFFVFCSLFTAFFSWVTFGGINPKIGATLAYYAVILSFCMIIIADVVCPIRRLHVSPPPPDRPQI